MPFRSTKDESLRCSFCHKAEEVVGKLISSPSESPRVYICDECVTVCYTILDDETKAPRTEEKSDADLMREHLASLLSWIPDGDLETVEKILHALAVIHPASTAASFPFKLPER